MAVFPRSSLNLSDRFSPPAPLAESEPWPARALSASLHRHRSSRIPFVSLISLPVFFLGCGSPLSSWCAPPDFRRLTIAFLKEVSLAPLCCRGNAREVLCLTRDGFFCPLFLFCCDPAFRHFTIGGFPPCRELRNYPPFPEKRPGVMQACRNPEKMLRTLKRRLSLSFYAMILRS